MIDEKKQYKLKKTMEKIIGLPTLPSILSNLNRMMMNPRTSAKQVAQLVSNDPALTSKILKIVNSSFYGFPNRITTVTHGIVILGFNSIKNIILSSSIFDVFKSKHDANSFNMQEFWKHSISCGVAAREIAKKLGVANLEEFFIAGLLHDLGKVVINQFFSSDAELIKELVNTKRYFMFDAEEEILGVSHADIGNWLFKKWNLSSILQESTIYHHNPTLASENPKLTAAVHSADILIKSMGIGYSGDKKIPLISSDAWNILNISNDNIYNLMNNIDEEFKKATVYMELT